MLKMDLSTYEKELWELIFAITKWKYYLYGRLFIIITNHNSLKYLFDQQISIMLQHKWLSKLLGYDYTIVYKPGKQNIPAHCLSRAHEDAVECLAMSVS